MESILSSSPSIPSVDTEPRFPFGGDGPSRPFDLDGLAKRIDAKIEELEAEKKKQASKKNKKHVVSVIMGGPNRKALAEVIAQERGISVKEATDIIDDLPADFEFAKKADAKRFLDKVSGTGCLAIIHEDWSYIWSICYEANAPYLLVRRFYGGFRINDHNLTTPNYR